MAGEGDEARDGPRPDEGRGREPYDDECIQSRPEPLRSRLLNLPGLKRQKDFLPTCPVLLLTLIPIEDIQRAKLPRARKEPDFRRKIFRNRYGSPYPFAHPARILPDNSPPAVLG